MSYNKILTRTIIFCFGRTIFFVTFGLPGPFMQNLFGPARPIMHPDQIFCDPGFNPPSGLHFISPFLSTVSFLEI